MSSARGPGSARSADFRTDRTLEGPGKTAQQAAFGGKCDGAAFPRPAHAAATPSSESTAPP